jgi:hypothetical protein
MIIPFDVMQAGSDRFEPGIAVVYQEDQRMAGKREKPEDIVLRSCGRLKFCKGKASQFQRLCGRSA